jgi:hypothetical protein
MNFSILVPIFRKTEELEIAIYNLRTYSYIKEHEILILGNDETENMLKWLDNRKDWLRKHNIRYHHCRMPYEKLATYPDGGYVHGARCAAAMNIGVEIATYDWICGISDDDLFYSYHWDKPIIDIIPKYDMMKYVFRPTHVQPRMEVEGEISVEDFWGEKYDYLVSHYRVIKPTIERFVTELEWNVIVAKMSQSGVIDIEPCGMRKKLHWLPMIMSRALIKAIGGWSLDKQHASCIDIEFDDRLAKKGISKVRCRDSFVLHKGIERKHLLTEKARKFIDG